jgi:hypothetical protein
MYWKLSKEVRKNALKCNDDKVEKTIGRNKEACGS